MATFLDTGQVFNSFKDVSFKDYRMTPGIGFRGIVRPNVVGRIDYGFSKEGGAIFAGLDFPYGRGAVRSLANGWSAPGSLGDLGRRFMSASVPSSSRRVRP